MTSHSLFVREISRELRLFAIFSHRLRVQLAIRGESKAGLFAASWPPDGRLNF